MKLTTTTMVTVDGVMEGLGGPDEDRRDGFERFAGSWATWADRGENPVRTAQVYRPTGRPQYETATPGT